jgi:mono/diheme cytochrome c family protein
LPPRSALPVALAGVAAGLLLVLLLGLIEGPQILGHREDYALNRFLGVLAQEFAAPLTARGGGRDSAADADTLARGRVLYAQSCGPCHGADGAGDGFWGKALYPNATDLRAHDTQEKSDAALTAIVRDGVSFAGMPGFGERLDADQTRAIVAYLRRLANMDGHGG